MRSPIYTIGQPGGPNGPFYSIVTDTGQVVAMRIVTREWAERIVTALRLLDAHPAGSRAMNPETETKEPK